MMVVGKVYQLENNDTGKTVNLRLDHMIDRVAYFCGDDGFSYKVTFAEQENDCEENSHDILDESLSKLMAYADGAFEALSHNARLQTLSMSASEKAKYEALNWVEVKAFVKWTCAK